MPNSGDGHTQQLGDSLLTLQIENTNTGHRHSSFGRPRSKSPAAAGSELPLDKSKLELQKVLSLIITRLQERVRPPTLIDQLSSDWSRRPSTRVDAVVESLRAVVRTASTGPKESSTFLYNDSDDAEPSGFSTSATLDMMVQLREILAVGHKQNWDIMPSQPSLLSLDVASPHSQGGLSSPFKRRRNSSARRARARSAESNMPLILDLRSRCIAVLADIIAEDCRYKVLSPRPATPPYALQAICLDVALALIEAEPQPQTMAAVGFAVLPAFDTFAAGLYPRLVAFFEDGLVRRMLERLVEAQGGNIGPHRASDAPIPNIPAISIRVGDADDTPNYALPPFSKSWSALDSAPRFLSPFAPHQTAEIYRLASLVSPLLASMLDRIDVSTASIETCTRVYRLYELIMDTKPDAYLDLLQIVAYHSPNARYSAMTLLANYWPEATGHLAVTRPFPLWRPNNRERVNASISPFEHEFVPWRFPANRKRGTTIGNADFSASEICQACGNNLYGFGLRCTLCPCIVHFSCYDSPSGSFLSQYPLNTEGGTHRVAVTRFSRLLPKRRGEESLEVSNPAGHHFCPVNLFNLTLCFICQLPLWGCVAQGLQCSNCQQFAHCDCVERDVASCAPHVVDASRITIDWETLKNSFLAYHHDLLIKEEEIIQSSYEDISIIYGALWMQLQLMMNGVASGSIIVEGSNLGAQAARGTRVDQFELQNRVRLLESYLVSGRNIKTTAVQEYQRSQSTAPEESILFDWPLLVYAVAAIKSALAAESAPLGTAHHEAAAATQCPEILTLSNIRSALGADLNVRSDAAARHFLGHLCALGLLRRVDRGTRLPWRYEDDQQTLCAFPIPLLLDTSVDVETLVSAIEAGLENINLSVNESAMLLLTRRCWPSIWASEYGLNRLAQALLSWLCSEDERLILVAKEYVSHQKPLPGVLSTDEPYAWPWTPSNRLGATGTAQSGAGYVNSRKLLLVRYIAPWLRALHQMDAATYASTMFDYCSHSALAKCDISDDILAEDADVSPDVQAQWGDDVLRYILRVCQSNTIFSCFEAVFIRWLDATSGITTSFEVAGYPLLPRLFNMEPETSQSIAAVPNAADSEATVRWTVHPWKVVKDVASSGQDGLSRAMKWLIVLTRSGVGIPVSTYSQTAAFVRDFNADFEAYERLMECITATCWLRPDSVLELLSLITTLHERLREWIIESMRQREQPDSIGRFIRLSLASCLLLVGFERDHVASSGLLDEKESGRMPSRRRPSNLDTSEAANFLFSIEIVEALARYAAVAPEVVCGQVASFLTALVSPSSPFSSQVLDQFIVLNSHPLAVCIWRFYDAELTRLAPQRASLLLRTIVVDTQPLEDIILSNLKAGTTPTLQLAAVARLSLILYDINSPGFQDEDRPWRKHIAKIVNIFFEQLWSGQAEDARHAAEVAANTLTHVHRDALTKCWNEHLLRGTHHEQIRLVSFLLQLHPYFPDWPILSWESIRESMLEDDYVSARGNDSEDILAHMLPSDMQDQGSENADVRLLRVLLVSLSLHFIGDGIPLDVLAALQIKHHLAKVLGFVNTRLVPNHDTFSVQFDGLQPIPLTSLPCVTALLRAIDCPKSLELRPSVLGINNDADTPSTCLVGTIFTDLVIAVVTNLKLSEMPYLMARAWLEMLIVFILKYDIESPVIRHLAPPLTDAVKHTTDLLQQDIPDDLRHLALSVSHAFLHAKPNMCAKILSRQIVAIISVLSSAEGKSDPVFVNQGTAFLESAFSRFAPLGLFKSLFKKDTLSTEFFDTLRDVLKADAKVRQQSGQDPLRNIILRSVIAKMVETRSTETEESQQTSLRHISNNLLMFVQRVHHENYPESLIADVALGLTNVARKAADWPSATFSPDPLLKMSCLIVRYNKASSRDLLLHMETLLRPSLLRFDVSLSTLQQIFTTIGSLFRRTNTVNFEISPNHLALAVVETLGEELRGRERSTVSTLAAMIDVVSATSEPPHRLFTPEILTKVTIQALGFLEANRAYERYTTKHLEPMLAAARLILRASKHYAEGVINETIGVASGRPNVPLKVWSALAIAALDESQSADRNALLAQTASFGVSYFNTMNSLSDQLFSRGLLPSAGSEVSHAFAAIKLWLLLAQCAGYEKPAAASLNDTDSDIEQRRIWNEAWPPFERLLALSANSDDEASLPILTMIWGSYVDLLTFLQTSGSIVVVDFAVTHTAMLQKLCDGVQAVSSLQKLSRCLSALQNPPAILPFTSLVEVAKNDLLAAEKLANVLLVSRRADAVSGTGGTG